MNTISTKKSSYFISSLCLGVALISFICGLYALSLFVQSTRIQQQQLLKRAKGKSYNATYAIDQFINQLIPLVTTTAAKLSNGTLEKNDLEQELVQKPIEVSGFGIAFSTNKAPEAHYYVEHEDTQKLVPLTNFAHFAAQDNWYTKALQSSGKYVGPLQDPITHQKIILYAAPFYDPKKNNTSPTGVVFATLSLDHIKHVISTLYTGQEGYSYIVDEQGTIIVHPHVQRGVKTITNQKINIVKNSIPIGVIKKAHANSPQPIHYYNSLTQEASVLFAHTIPSTNWLLISTFSQHVLSIDNDFMRHKLTVILLYFLLTLFFIICAAFIFYFYYDPIIWLSSGLIALLFLIGIGTMWYLAIRYPSYNKNLVPITNKAQLYQFLDTLKKTKSQFPAKKETVMSRVYENTTHFLHYRYKHEKYIPTGFLINDIHFSDVDQVEFVGYVWQRYFDGIHDGISRGFIFPQMADAPTINQISEIKKGKTQIIIWQVRSKLNQEMDYYKYPFDTKDIQIQVRHKDFDKNILLVPDLDAYQLLNPKTLPGVARTTHMTGWYLMQSFFGYELSNYTTNFGLYSYGPFGIYDNALRTANTPELYFNITTNRHLIDTIVTNLLVLVLIALILFILLLIYTLEGFGWIIGTVTGALFSTILAQVNFRAKVPSQTFVYFETFYFIFYFIIMLTLVSSLLHQFKIDVRLISYRKNIITKVLYWPLLLGLVFATTLYYLS